MRPASCWSVEVMNGAPGRRVYGLASTERTGSELAGEAVPDRGGRGLVRAGSTRPSTGRGGEPAVVAEVLARCQALHRRARRGWPGRRLVLGGVGVVERGLQVPPGGRVERHALPLPLHHDTGGHRLHATGREPGHDLLPQHRRDLVAVEAVEDAAGLLGVDQAAVELAGIVDGVLDRLGGDLVEHHPPDRDLGVEHLEQVPGDGLPLAVLIRRQVELVGVLQQRP